jgi:hypothetical protein
MDRLKVIGRNFIAFNEKSHFNLSRMILVRTMVHDCCNGSDVKYQSSQLASDDLPTASSIRFIWENSGIFTGGSTDVRAESAVTSAETGNRSYAFGNTIPALNRAGYPVEIGKINFKNFVVRFLSREDIALSLRDDRYAFNRLVAAAVRHIQDKHPGQQKGSIPLTVIIPHGVSFRVSEIFPPNQTGTILWTKCKNICDNLPPSQYQFFLDPGGEAADYLDRQLLDTNTFASALWGGLTPLGAQAWRMLVAIYDGVLESWIQDSANIPANNPLTANFEVRGATVISLLVKDICQKLTLLKAGQQVTNTAKEWTDLYLLRLKEALQQEHQ